MAKPIERAVRAEKKLFIGPYEGCEHKNTVVILHGWGDNAVGWYEAALWFASKMRNTRFVLPSAPMVDSVHSWWNFESQTCWDVTHTITALVREEKKDVKQVAVMGFSQGGALAVGTLLNEAEPLAAVVGMSSFLSARSGFTPLGKLDTPIFLAHGDRDDVVSSKSLDRAASRLRNYNFTNVTTEMYPNLTHSTCVEEFEDIVSFLNTSFQKDAKL